MALVKLLAAKEEISELRKLLTVEHEHYDGQNECSICDESLFVAAAKEIKRLRDMALRAVPEDWQAVPKEPTTEIRMAFQTEEELPWPEDGDAIRQAWQHYLAAAPKVTP